VIGFLLGIASGYPVLRRSAEDRTRDMQAAANADGRERLRNEEPDRKKIV
jgi:hypothetical protein